jgi:hypothetical protein
LSLNEYGVELTRFITNGTLDAFFLVNSVNFLFLTRDSLLRAFPETDVAAVTVFFIYFVVEEFLADTAGALLIVNVRFIFVAKVGQGGENRIRGGSSQSAKGELDYRVGKIFQ